ncbi:hypothetical protein HPG69_002749, partial [Diceros bicornis minor]
RSIQRPAFGKCISSVTSIRHLLVGLSALRVEIFISDLEMESSNQTIAQEFIFSAFPYSRGDSVICFVPLLFIYTFIIINSLCGNDLVSGGHCAEHQINFNIHDSKKLGEHVGICKIKRRKIDRKWLVEVV